MATQAYWDWVAAGEPWRVCKPALDIEMELRNRLGGDVGPYLQTIGNRETHLRVDFPQDHAPFSFTEWPVKVNEYVVHALDVMHEPDLGLDCDPLFRYWLAEAKAGRQPWLKYIIWQAKLYDVRNDWRAEPSNGHDDHIHMSFRTDWMDRGIGGWSPLPTGDDDMADPEVMAALNRIAANTDATYQVLGNGRRREGSHTTGGLYVAPVLKLLQEIKAELAELRAAVKAK